MTLLDQPFRLGRKNIRGRFVIPSGIRCTHAATIEKCFREVPSVGVVTTKSISFAPRAGYREPIYARYSAGCYINAVGLANPGAEKFMAECEGLEVPEDKFLLVSIFGSDVETFVKAAQALRPIADGFELNMSCPHAKGYGAEVGQDRELLKSVIQAVAECAGAPVIVKFSATLADLPGAAEAALRAGAAGFTLINTIGPASAYVGEEPILYNKLGGLSGDGIRSMGLRAIMQVRKAVGPEPVIIGMGGIAAPEHVRQFAKAGADLFGIGSALTGLDSDQMRDYVAALDAEVRSGQAGPAHRCTCESRVGMDYLKTTVRERVDLGPGLFKLILEELPEEYAEGELAGKFFFLTLPGVGEKPFAIFSACEKSVVVRVVGEFTKRLGEMEAGAEIWVRGPYGRGIPEFQDRTIVHLGGGTGIASLLEIAQKLKDGNRQIFLLGARSVGQMFGAERFEELGEVRLATDDGSLGMKGFVSDLLSQLVIELAEGDKERAVYINCGPGPMVRKCFEIERQVAGEDRILGSIEYMTSCGVGICGKCSSPSGALTCIDGPFLGWREFQPR